MIHAADRSLDLGDVPTWIGAVGTLVAFLIAAAVAVWQVRHQRSLAAVERTIALHRDLTAGDIGLSRDRLSEYMWRFAAKRGTGTCWQPTWAELLGSRYAPLPKGARDLSRYYPDMGADAGETPLHDLYKILWCFERIRNSGRNGLLDRTLSAQILGNHAVWWHFFCANIPEEATRYRRNLRELADWYLERDGSLGDWAAGDFATRPVETTVGQPST